MKKLYLALASFAVVLGGVLLFGFMSTNSNAAPPRDCDNNAIIHCGAVNAKELATAYNANKTKDLKAVYSHYGLSSAEMTNANKYAKMGQVHKDGRVTVDGKTVATDAMSIGRKNIFSNSKKITIGGKTYYNTAPKHSFVPKSITAFVFFDKNGDFKSAVLTSCGNPVSAKKPVYKCNDLTKEKISRTEYRFSAKAEAKNGASIVSYTYDFGDGTKETKKSTKTTHSITHKYKKPGTYKVKLTVTMKVHGTNKTVTAKSCEETVVVDEEPPKPVYTCDELTFKEIDRIKFKYEFTGKATAEGGAEIVDYTFDFDDGNTATVDNPENVPYTYEKPGTYNVTLAVKFKVNGKEETKTGEKCQVEVSPEAEPEEPCKPCEPCDKPGENPEDDPECKEVPEVPAELPKTGPMDIVASIIGLGSLAAAGFYWYASRKGLLTALLNRQ